MYHSDKFSHDDMIEMAIMRIEGHSAKEISEHFNCQMNSVYAVLKGNTNKARAALGLRLIERLENLPYSNRQFVPEQIRHIRRLRERGFKHREIADIFEVSIPTIENILANRAYTDVD